MTTSTTYENPSSADVFGDLEGVCVGHGLSGLAGQLGELRPWLGGDLDEIDGVIAGVVRGDSLAHLAARHLLDLEGKRVRPLCVALASHVGSGFGPAARQLAVAVELVHSATLLHDDVVDLGERRRGAAAARVVYGNAASIFGGDWLLVEALSRIQASGVPGVMEEMLEVIKQMVVAESLQLARRGRVRTRREEYFAVVEGKTAALFRWAMLAGARAGGVGAAGCAALEAFGRDVGVAFQVVDDVLDVAGDESAAGKTLLADLREGKMTYPLILALERDPALGPALEAIAGPEQAGDPETFRRVADAVSDPRVVAECLELSSALCRRAAAGLVELPASRARSALEAVALSNARRQR